MKRQKEVDFMALTNTRAAFVNRSGSAITVYNSLVHSSAHTGGNTAGGGQKGTIYNNEAYTIEPNSSSYITSYKIHFRDANGNFTVGYIETNPNGVSYPIASWAQYQELYHLLNSNGSGLTSSKTATINGTTYRTFTVKRSLGVMDKNRHTKDPVASGTMLATTQSTVGVNYPGYMIFNKKKLPGSSTWQDLIPGETYGFVDLGLSYGSMPNNRPIW